jgi:glucose/mannose-6-phosphate isomerase
MALDPPYGERDAGGMAARLDATPEQIEDAVARYQAGPWSLPSRFPSMLAVGAMGGSAISGDLTFGLYSDQLPRPLLVVRDYRWPAFVTREAFALLCSYSGNTEETLGLYAEARKREVPRAVISSGGALAVACGRDGVPCHKLPGGSPPRAALFTIWVPLTALVHALQWCDDPMPAWRDAAARLRALRDRIGTHVPEEGNPAKRLARRLAGRMLFLFSATERTAPVAARMRQQLHENAKVLAHSAPVPEFNHNEIVGWERPGALHRGASVLLLRDAEDSVPVARRLDLTAEYAERQGAEVHVLESPPGGRLARLAAQVAFGDYLSLYLALAQGVDPTPIASIDEFKRRLAEAGTQRGT